MVYAGEMLNGIDRFDFHIFHIINEPETDFFPNLTEKARWLQEEKEKAKGFMSEYRKLLVGTGISPEHVFIHVKVRYCPSVAECILKESKQMDCKTIVIGRKGVTREEEFLFGSVSNKIIHKAQDCTVWVVE